MLTPLILCLMTANSMAAVGAIFAAPHISAFEAARLRSTTTGASEDECADVISFVEDKEIRDAA